MNRSEEFRQLLCSDDPDDLARARRMADNDQALAEILSAQTELDASIRAWKDEAAAPASLRGAVLQSIKQEIDGATTARTPSGMRSRLPAAWGLWSWQGALAAAAAIAFLTFALRTTTFEPSVVSTSGKLLIADALQAAHDAERRHAEAIAALESAVNGVLGRASDPSLRAADAAVLMAYRDRVAALDTAIAEVRSYLDENPGLASARTVLLAAYIDKTRLLEEILERDTAGELG